MQAAKQQAQAQQAKPAVQDLEEVSEPRCQIEHSDEATCTSESTSTAAPVLQQAVSTTETASSSLASFSSFPAPVHFPTPAAQPESLVQSSGGHPYPNTGLAPPQHDQYHPHQHQHQHHDHHHPHQHVHVNGHVEAALATLYHKMEEARQRLAVTPVAQSAPLVVLISECARAIQALQSLNF